MLQSIVSQRVDLKQIQELAGKIPLGLGAGESFSVALSALWAQGGLFCACLWAHLSGLCVQGTALGIIFPFTWSITYICSWVISAAYFLPVESLKSHSFPSFCLCPLQSRLAVFLLIRYSHKPLLVFSVCQGNPCHYTRGFSTDPSCINHMSVPGFCWGGWLDLLSHTTNLIHNSLSSYIHPCLYFQSICIIWICWKFLKSSSVCSFLFNSPFFNFFLSSYVLL